MSQRIQVFGIKALTACACLIDLKSLNENSKNLIFNKDKEFKLT